MQQLDKIKQYACSVCEQIRWKKAHNIISDEIENHITDQKNAFMAEGIGEAEAVDKAIREMGDPVVVGSQLDRTHRPKTEWSMIALTGSLIILGLVINLFVKNDIPNERILYFPQNAVLAAIIGVICMFATYCIDFTIIGKYPKLVYGLFIVFILTISIFAMPEYGVRRWIVLPFIGTVFTSNFLLLFPTAYAGIIYSMRNKGYLGIILCGVFFIIPAIACLPAGYGISSIFVCTAACFALLIISICKSWFRVNKIRGLMTVIVPSFIIPFLLIRNSYYSARLAFLFNPSSDPTGWGYTMIVTRDMISGAKLFGQGDLPVRYANDAAKWLPSINIDYLITYLIHRIGWVSFIAIIALLLAFMALGFYLCFKQKSILGGLVSASVLLTIIMQIVVYISANLGFQAFSQLTLPLISYGGVATIINLSLIGIMLSVFKSGDLERDKQILASSNGRKFLEFVDGKIVIDISNR